jgi:hypothetical protein
MRESEGRTERMELEVYRREVESWRVESRKRGLEEGKSWRCWRERGGRR